MGACEKETEDETRTFRFGSTTHTFGVAGVVGGGVKKKVYILGSFTPGRA